MHEHENTPETLVSVPNDLEAAMIVSALAARDIDATTSGGYTAGFRAEAPGEVQVLVRHRDLPRAKMVLNELTPHRPSDSPALTTDRLAADGEQWISWRGLGLLAVLAGTLLYLWS